MLRIARIVAVGFTRTISLKEGIIDKSFLIILRKNQKNGRNL